MELWIRSQDKELLVLAKGFELQNPSYNGGCQIFAVWQNNYQCVGNYKSKERALEILNEIQNLLQPKIKYIQEEPVESIVDFGYQITQNVDMKIQEINRIVYEMPKE